MRGRQPAELKPARKGAPGGRASCLVCRKEPSWFDRRGSRSRIDIDLSEVAFRSLRGESSCFRPRRTMGETCGMAKFVGDRWRLRRRRKPRLSRRTCGPTRFGKSDRGLRSPKVVSQSARADRTGRRGAGGAPPRSPDLWEAKVPATSRWKGICNGASFCAKNAARAARRHELAGASAAPSGAAAAPCRGLCSIRSAQ